MASCVRSDGVYALLQHLGGVESGCGEVWEMEELVLSTREKSGAQSKSSFGYIVGPCPLATSCQDWQRKRTPFLASKLSLMLRLRPSHIFRAVHSITDSLLSQLRPIVGDLQSAQNELRWLREESQKRASEPEQQQSLLEEYVSRRSRGEPLQYILGSMYFGDLQLKCRSGVFIPRLVPRNASLLPSRLIRLGLRPLLLSRILYNLY